MILLNGSQGIMIVETELEDHVHLLVIDDEDADFVVGIHCHRSDWSPKNGVPHASSFGSWVSHKAPTREKTRTYE